MAGRPVPGRTAHLPPPPQVTRRGHVTLLPGPPVSRPAVVDWVDHYLAGLFNDDAAASPSFVGGQTAADEALAGFSVRGYAGSRNEVWPPERRGASRLSPYIRHGLLPLRRVWEAVGGGPTRDVAKYRDELLWQEYARHVYARLGTATRDGLRAVLRGEPGPEPWPDDMACVAMNVAELQEHGWLVNQTRMWLASQWAVRRGADWRQGEDRFFQHLLDGSRAANRAGWQWTVGTATGRPYGFSRRQVERRAPGICESCGLRDRCPIEDWPSGPPLERIDADPRVRSDPDPDITGGPRQPEIRHEPAAVWLTAESLGDADPALAAHPGLPAVFVFDEPLLTGLQLSAKRLVFLAETLGDLADRRTVEVHRGDPESVLAGRPVATTFAPVPGWRRRAVSIDVAELHPWPWLHRPHGTSVASYSAWRKAL
ncbi:MAG: deoxyribodipyrimidine photolyase [Acidimicrobiia bacterium]|nr:deoxyribodipyrimidine photolyase [Acidimicrobiia bacterium]